MRLGLIGVGRIGALHASNLSSMPEVDSLAVCDIVRARVLRIAERLDVEVAADADALLHANVDGVIIAASTDAHPDLVLAANRLGLPVFCEKPIAPRLDESLALLRELRASDGLVQLGYQRRFDLGFRAARAAVNDGQLGWLHTVRSTTLDPAPPSPEYVAASGGLFHDCAVHDFDAIRWVTGREVAEVFALGENGGESFFADAGDVDTCAAVLRMDDGTLALVSNARYNARGYDVRLEVHGSRDSLAVGLEDKLPLRSVEPGATFPAGQPHSMFMERFALAYRDELAAFVDLVTNGGPSPCPIEDAIEAEWIAEACTRSWREHRPVTIAEVKR